MKKIIALIVMLLMVCLMAIPTAAAVPDTAVPLWENINKITSNIGFDGTSGIANGSIIGDPGTDEITATLSVYVQDGDDWVLVGRDSGTIESVYLVLTVNFTAESGAYYKSVLEVTVTIDGVEEDETITKYKTCE